jgi:hypothetical protein
MKKSGISIEMSYDITDSEKQQAEKAVSAFKQCLKVLKQAKDHLNIMLTPFKNHPDISEDQIFKFRAALRRYRDESIENFNNFKIMAFKCITLMQMFSFDTQIYKLMKSFIASIEKLEIEVNKFAELFSNLKSKEFVSDIVKSIESIQKECDIIYNIVYSRLISHISTNILATNWVDEIGKKINKSIEYKAPLIIDLFNKHNNENS